VLTPSLRDLDRAFKAFSSKRARHPRFKKRRGEQAVRYQLDGRLKRNCVAGSRLVLPNLGPLKLVWSRVPPGRPKMVTLRRDGVGRYFVSMSMDEEILPLPAANRALGVDAGLTAAVTLDDGTKVAPPPVSRKEAETSKDGVEISPVPSGAHGGGFGRGGGWPGSMLGLGTAGGSGCIGCPRRSFARSDLCRGPERIRNAA
jgi:hypothetical protein